MSQETIEREFAVVAPATLELANIRGSVDVQPGDDSVVTITAVKHLNTGDPDRTEIDIGQEENGSVTVKTLFERGGWLFSDLRRACKVDYIVRVPRACDLKVRDVSSRASVQGLEGEFDIKTVSGQMSLSDLSGKVKATSVSGKVIGERLSGPVAFESVSGKVFLTESHMPTVTGSSVSGGPTWSASCCRLPWAKGRINSTPCPAMPG